MKSLERVNFKLYPTEEQKEIMLLNCHNARFAYNWAVARIKECLDNKQIIPSKYKLATEFNKFKQQPGYEWLNKKPASQRATKLEITNSISMSIVKFRKNQNNCPSFHSKKCARMAYYAHERSTLYEHDKVRLENVGWVKCRNNLPLSDENVKICDPRVIFTGDYFELSCCIKRKTPVKPKYHYTDVDIHHQPIGIDVGIVHMAVTSDGDFYDLPSNKLSKIDKQIARIDRRIDRSRRMNQVTQTCDTKTKYPEYEVKSQNLLKLESRRRKLYSRHRNIRKDIRCQAVADVVKRQPSAIVIEDIIDPRASWKIKGAHKFNKKIDDAAIGDFLYRIKYKCDWLDIPLIIADKHYPSSKTCSCCGNTIDNQLTKDRMFICSVCGYKEDRDLNAAYNLRSLAYNDSNAMDLVAC